MKVTVKYFASIRETLGCASEVRNTQASTLGALRDELLLQGDAYAESLSRGKAVRLALNQLLSDETAGLKEGDEVAFFPPVTGG